MYVMCNSWCPEINLGFHVTDSEGSHEPCHVAVALYSTAPTPRPCLPVLEW